MDQNINAFLRVLDANDNSTGGGTASSVAGAMAAGLAGMVARLSIGKKDLASQEHYEAIAAEAETLSEALFNGGHLDADAFDEVSAAYRLPKDTEEAKVSRSRTIQEAMVHAAEIPLANAERCNRVLELCRSLEKSYNTNAASDLECAGFLALAGLKGCAANVRINLPYIKDQDVSHEIEQKLKKIVIEEEQ